MWPDTRLTDLFGVELPVVAAPMANFAGLDLAVAVAEAGGLGSLPCAVLDPDRIRSEVAAFRSRVRRPVNLNFFCHVEAPPDPDKDRAWLSHLAPYFAELGVEAPSLPLKAGHPPFGEADCAAVEATGPEVVSFHFGLPAPGLLARVKKVGCKIISSATTLREAEFLAANGVDAIIAQGAEAGGHRGMFLETDVATQVGTFALVRAIADSVKVPVIAAGGIADGKAIAAALALGASAVQIGTAYLLCPEATISALHRTALSAARPQSPMSSRGVRRAESSIGSCASRGRSTTQHRTFRSRGLPSRLCAQRRRRKGALTSPRCGRGRRQSCPGPSAHANSRSDSRRKRARRFGGSLSPARA
jgi:nitronate monooxygenase